MASGSAIRAGGAFVELFTKDSKLERGLRAAQKKVSAWAGSVQKIGLGVLAVGAGFVGAFAAAANTFSNSGDALDKMAIRTGIAVESLSALQFAADQSGTSIGTVEKAVKRMATTLLDAERGSADAVDSLKAIGLTAAELKGKKPEEQFLTIAEALSKVTDHSTKAALAQKLFGRAGTELLPLLQEGKAGIAELVKEAQRLGIVMTTAEAKSAADFNDALGRIKAQSKALVFQIGGALAPALTAFIDVVKGSLATVIDWAKQNSETVKILGLLALGLVAGGSALLAFGLALKVVAISVGVVLGLLGLIKAAVLFLVSPLGLVLAAVTGITAAFLTMTQTGQGILGSLSGGVASLKADFLNAFAGIKDAIAAGNIQLAFQILIAFLKVQWKKFVVYMNTNWAGFMDFFFAAIEAIKIAWIAVKETFITIAGVIKSAWTATVKFIVQIWNGMIGILEAAWNGFADFINAALDKLPKKLDPGYRVARANFGGAKVNTSEGKAGGPNETPEQKTRREKSEADLKAAQAELQRLIGQAAKERKEKEDAAKPAPKQVQQAAKSAVETASKSVGTFSATVANRTAFDQVRIPRLQLNAQKQTVAKLEEIAAGIRSNVLVWAD